MKKNLKFITAVFSAMIILTSSLVTASAADSAPFKASQKHTVNNYTEVYESYKEKYLNGCGVPLDGTNGSPDMCIPGLSSSDGMCPQGMTYVEKLDQIFISAYPSEAAPGKNRPGAVFALDRKTGKLVAQYNIYNANGTPCAAHLGGIAASGLNVYFADADNFVSYIPLSSFNISSGVKNLKIAARMALKSDLKGTTTAYMSYGNGCLWTGNFYRKGDSTYQRAADKEYNSICIGYKLSGKTSAQEWQNLRETPITYTLCIPNTISTVQCVAVDGSKVYIGSSYGRKNESKLYSAKVRFGKNSRIEIKDAAELTNMPMSEGMFVLNGKLYILFESATYVYNGYSSVKSKDPSDVVWTVSTSAISPKSAGFGDFFTMLSSIFSSLFGFITELFKSTEIAGLIGI